MYERILCDSRSVPQSCAPLWIPCLLCCYTETLTFVILFSGKTKPFVRCKGGLRALAMQEQMSQQSSLSAATLDETLSLETLARVLSAELQLNAGQIARTIALLDTGNAIPFIARYRKEVTGSLDEVQIQAIADR